MQETLDNILLLKRDYPHLTFQIVFDDITSLEVTGRTKTVRIPLKNLSIDDVRTRIRLFMEID